jgi:hypothetical protein
MVGFEICVIRVIPVIGARHRPYPVVYHHGMRPPLGLGPLTGSLTMNG